MEIKLPLYAKDKIIAKYEDYKKADYDFVSSSIFFKISSVVTLLNFLVFSYGVMDPITLKEKISIYGYHFSQIFLVVGFLLTKFFLDKKNISQKRKIEISSELNRDYKLNIERNNNNYSVTIAVDNSKDKWIFQNVNIFDISCYEEIKKELWISSIQKLP